MSFWSIVGNENEDNVVEEDSACRFPINDTYQSRSNQMTFLYRPLQNSELKSLVFSYRHGTLPYNHELIFSNCTCIVYLGVIPVQE